MDELRRRRYLQALGIEVWESRAKGMAATPLTDDRVTGRAPSVDFVASRLPPPASRPVPQDWAGLQAAVAGCRKCRLCETRTNTVFGVGPSHAPLMVVGEGPGADEDARGEPFVGRAGKLLDEMLKAIGRSRKTDTYIANVVKCRPPGNREPAADEAEACRAYLEQQLRLVKPKLIVALGRVAAQRLLVTDTPIGRMRGQRYSWGPDATPLMVTYHPAYLLRSPGDKAKSWEDLKRIHRYLSE
ncbi:MAG: uracil-DNA glycosylase [Nevskiales bacterium]|nr:uracil-DNA glycosylase [Nevskiales bacterium]